MAVTVSGLYINTHKKFWDGSDLVFDYVNDTVKVAMFTNAITPNFSTDTAYGAAPYNANEVSGTGYTAGGVALGTKTISESPTGTLMIDAADSSWASSTITNARCALVYDATVASPVNAALCLVNFGADYSTSSGTFTIQWASGGIWTIDLTP